MAASATGCGCKATLLPLSAPPPPPPPQPPLKSLRFEQLVYTNKCSTFSIPIRSTQISSPFPTHIPRSSSSSSTPVVVDEETATPPMDDNTPAQFESTGDSDSLRSIRGCKACGKEEMERGCNGEGRIQGGIATVPGFGWWPIKAYRPCPAFVASGGKYRRTGQSMDEVASGRSGRSPSKKTSDAAK